MKAFCNVARPVGARTLQLPDLLRTWFGPCCLTHPHWQRGRHPNQKLEERDVIEIHRLAADGGTVMQLHRRFGMSKNTIPRILASPGSSPS